jgi:hypothetical protein
MIGLAPRIGFHTNYLWFEGIASPPPLWHAYVMRKLKKSLAVRDPTIDLVSTKASRISVTNHSPHVPYYRYLRSRLRTGPAIVDRVHLNKATTTRGTLSPRVKFQKMSTEDLISISKWAGGTYYECCRVNPRREDEAAQDDARHGPTPLSFPPCICIISLSLVSCCSLESSIYPFSSIKSFFDFHCSPSLSSTLFACEVVEV